LCQRHNIIDAEQHIIYGFAVTSFAEGKKNAALSDGAFM
jgi:hypothetical protein